MIRKQLRRPLDTTAEGLPPPIYIPPSQITLNVSPELFGKLPSAVILPPALFAAIETHLTLEAEGRPSSPEIARRLLAKLQALKA